MTPEAQRIAIAEACGWQPYKYGWNTAISTGGIAVGIGAATVGELPDYLNDLNAMHEAERFLDCDFENDNQEEYVRRLVDGEYFDRDGLGYIQEHGDISLWDAAHATAAQRAEAFLRTLNLWQD